MFKIIFALVLIGIVVFFTPIGQGTRMAIDNKINPITKQGRVLGAATENLKKAKELANSGKFGNIEPAKLQELNSLLDDVKSNLNEAEDITKKGDAVAAIGGLISSVIPDKAGPSCVSK